MSKLVKILYDVGAIRRRYQRVHEDVCGFSTRKLLSVLKSSRGVDQAKNISVLQDVLAQLDRARQALTALDDADLSIRRGREIQQSLLDYIQALAETTDRLLALSLSRGTDRVASDQGRGDEPSALKIAYDDAVQNHRRCGSRLNELIATL